MPNFATKIGLKIWHYLTLLDAIVIDAMGDIKSLRYQLIIAAYALNIYLFKHSANPKVQVTALGLLTAAYLFYFSSKHSQAKNEHELKLKGMDDDSDEVSADPEP